MAPPVWIAALTLTGYTEAFYQWNVNDPANGLTNFRGFDNRHNSFTIANAVLDAAASEGAASARLALQLGHTPETYYLAEPSSPGAPGAGSTSASVWKYLQQANVGLKSEIGLTVEVGIFLSPIGPEGIAVKDQWNWSRSNLFFGLPFYHTGLRLSYALADGLTVMLTPCNGWNSVVDNNAEKSVAVELSWTRGGLSAHLLYMTGVERPEGAPEGEPWRHLFDAYAVWQIHPRFAFLLHGDAGFEPNDVGTSSWWAAAVAARFQADPRLYLAARGDFFQETVPGDAGAIFWPSQWVSSQTATVDFRPHDQVSVRLEYRHDEAVDSMFFEGAVATDAMGAFVADAERQDTITAGMVAWF
jgi:hypothetical protein